MTAAVKPGRRSDAALEILDGVTEGDSVILFPSDRIATGIRVKARTP